MIPLLVEGCADHEMRMLAQAMSSMDARIAALRQAMEDAETTRAATTLRLTALILRRELEEAERAETGALLGAAGTGGGGHRGLFSEGDSYVNPPLRGEVAREARRRGDALSG